MAGEEAAKQELLRAGGQDGVRGLAGGGDVGRGCSVTEKEETIDGLIWKRFEKLESEKGRCKICQVKFCTSNTRNAEAIGLQASESSSTCVTGWS